MIQARLLGSPYLTVDGELAPPELLWRKHLALCLLLWFAPEQRRSRDRIIGMLWSEKDERAARHSLSEALRVTRRVAGADAIAAEGDFVRWVAPVRLDTERFQAVEHSDPESAAALIAGDFCDGFSVPEASEFEEWLCEERGRWRSRLVAVLAQAAAIAEDRGDADGARTLADRAMAIEPNSDRAVRAAVRARWLVGDRTGAIALGDAFRTRVEEQLGITPDEETESLLQRIAGSRRPARPSVRRQRAARHPPLLARDAELLELMTAWRHSASSARATLLVLNGDPGMGRSRLLEEFTVRAMLEGAAVTRLRSVELDGRDPDAVWLGIAAGGLINAPGVPAAAPVAIRTLASRDSAWAERFPSVEPGDVIPVSDAVQELLATVADEGPIVVSIDDAQRLHPDSLQALSALLRSMEKRPVTLALAIDRSVSSAAADELRRRAGRDLAGAVVRVGPLDEHVLERMVTGALSGWAADASRRLARRLHADSGGAPAIAVEILAAVVDGLALVDLAATWPAPARTLDATMPGPLPEALVAAVRLAFRRLPEGAQTLLPLAALLPEPFLPGRLAALSGLSDIESVLDFLEAEQWLVLDGRGYSFRAKVVRRLVGEEMLTPGQRRRLLERMSADT